MAVAQQAAVLRSSSPSLVDPHHPDTRQPARTKRRQLILVRGIVWGIIGLIYAPLFLALVAILERLGAGPLTYVGAAALAGAAGAALYGARELALVGTGVGVIVGLLLLTTASRLIAFEVSILVAAGVATVLGLLMAVPQHCTRQVPGKVMAGLATGAFCGAVLAVAEPLHPSAFSPFALLAVLVSANGILYVAGVRWWILLSRRVGGTGGPCKLVASLALATLAGIASGSIWIMAGPLLGESAGLAVEVSRAVYPDLQLAMLGGIFGGAVAGTLLEVFGFSWVHDA